MKPKFFVADAHPDTGYNPNIASLLSFLDYAEQESSGLVLLGDCWGDLLTKRFETCLRDEHVSQWTQALVMLAYDTDVWFVPGNHDPLTGREGRQMMSLLTEPKMHFVKSGWLHGEDIGLPGLIATHGHWARFDLTTPIWDGLIGAGNWLLGEAKTEYLCQWILSQVFGRKLPNPGDMLRTGTVHCDDAPADVVYHPATVAEAMHRINTAHVQWLQQQRDVRVMVCGHSHSPGGVVLPDGRRYFNVCMDGYRSEYLAVYDTDRIELRRFP